MFYVSGDDKIKDVKVQLRGGEGNTTFEKFFPDDKLPKSYKVFAEMVLEPGCSVGQHGHQGESEIYYVLSGTGEINVNGETLQAKPGDVAVCHSGSFHSAKNTSDKELRILAMIVYEPA
ncbi:MAG: cupin domain-containing protein [Gracilibacteraceae bacterium]|jgi:quercetin dioxygenase-like cupin family protein|nr:cupin domain-containing protein [Gracilibacteraceae bacterium]